MTLHSLLKKIEFLAETKVDGLSASIRYKSRKLYVALTRGDGIYGEDITNNIKFVKGVNKYLPSSFPGDLEIRGEIFMPKATFYNLNIEREKRGEQKFSTARNAASGSIRQLDPLITKSRKLSFFGYTVLDNHNFFGKSLTNSREVLERNNFSLNLPCKLCNTVSDMIEFYEKVSNNRDKLDYDIDGIVYKVNSYEQQKVLGYTSRFPKWALAHKFPAESATTKVINIKYQVGRTGTITPVAILKETIIGGVKINRSTLHNEDEIKRLDLKIGDNVILLRAGDVIPKITRVIKSNRKGNEKEIVFPIKCPSCNKILTRSNSEVALRCTNYDGCSEQSIHRLRHFVSRQAFNIEGFGEKQIRLLWKEKIIKNFNDIFLLEKSQNEGKINLLRFEGWGEKSISNLFSAIRQGSNISFDRLIYSLGIRNVGSEIAIILSNNFRDIEEFIDAFSNKEHNIILNYDGIGEIIINSLKDFFLDTKRVKLIRDLVYSLNITYSKPLKYGKLLGKKVVITGSFEKLSRKDIEKKLITEGAKISSSVTKNIDFLIVGKDPGSKLKKAENLNIDTKDIEFINEIMKD